MSKAPFHRLRPRDADATRKSLLKAATAEFAQAGYAGARVDAIAERARVNKRMIYVYFGDKEALYGEVLRSRLALPPFSRDIEADPKKALTGLVRWYFRLLADDPELARLLAWGLLAGNASRHALLLSSAAPALDFVSRVVRRGIESGLFRADLSPEVLRTFLVSLCLGYFVQHDAMVASHRQEGLSIPDEEFLDELCRLLFGGITDRRA